MMTTLIVKRYGKVQYANSNNSIVIKHDIFMYSVMKLSLLSYMIIEGKSVLNPVV